MGHIYNEAGLDSFTQQIYIESFLSIKHGARHLGYRGEQDT